ncbi:phosphate regulon sensor protein PhoR, partial [Xanthomonas phaseoli]
MPQHIRSAWLKTLGTLALLLGAAVVAGVLIGHVWMALTLTALGVLAWHYWRLRQVLRRLTARQRAEPAAGIGAWNELDRLLYRSQDEMRARKRRLIEMLRTYRAAAQALPDAVVVVDRNSQRVQWFNKAAGGLLGLHHPGDMGVSIVERLQPLPLAHWLAAG